MFYVLILTHCKLQMFRVDKLVLLLWDYSEPISLLWYLIETVSLFCSRYATFSK